MEFSKIMDRKEIHQINPDSYTDIYTDTRLPVMNYQISLLQRLTCSQGTKGEKRAVECIGAAREGVWDANGFLWKMFLRAVPRGSPLALSPSTFYYLNLLML